ncbi:MAG: class I SAM-dependent methyltransferase [Acidobacteria bacterium]|nr:class I SAM-dependent methyltransferase [Acidobacteriota bacterium]
MTHRMYGDLAEWWPLFSPVGEYEEEARLFREALIEYATKKLRTMLELGSGGGHNAFHLRGCFEMTLVDRSEAMLGQSRKLNPDLPHFAGDMRDVRMEREFDAVFVHDAISYMTTREDLRAAMRTAFTHCSSGGVALFVPDETRERFAPSTSCGGTDDGARGFRYLEWVWDPDPKDETCVADYAFLIRENSRDVRVVHERHQHGVFPRQCWIDMMAEVGFEPHTKVVEHSELPNGYEFFIGVKS